MVDDGTRVAVTIKLHLPLSIAAQIMRGNFRITSLEHNAGGHKTDDSFDLVDAECAISKSDKVLLDEYLEERSKRS